MSSDSGSSLSPAEDQLAVVQRYLVLQAEQEGTQKRTFSKWINSQLSKHPRASAVKDLFVDIQNGHVLLDLLEVLSGENLPREKGTNLFQARSNIESALNFLGTRSIKLINIHVEDIIGGKPSIVLGLIWKIILHFHIEGLASILETADDQQPVKCETKNGVSPTASPSHKRSAKSRWKNSAKKALLQWAQERCAQLGSSINITDFKSSWRNGAAFLAIIQSLRPDLIDMDKFQGKSNDEKLNEAFRIAENELKIPKLIEPEDLNVSDPDEKSIMTYVAQFLQYSKNMEEPTRDLSARVHKAMEWLNEQEQTLKKLFSEMKDETYTKKYQEILLFMRKFNEQKRIFMSGLVVESLQAEEQLLIKQSLENITFQIAEWKKQLDRSLPPPLDSIETWLAEVENLMSQALPESGSHRNTMSLLQELSNAFKALIVDAKNHMESIRAFKNVDGNGVVIVPTDKTEEMKSRLEKILAANFSVLLDYRCAGYNVLALLEEGRPKLKSWKVKYKSQESVESLFADYKEFVEGKQFMVLLETAFQTFRELHNLLLTTDDYSNDPEISKQYEAIELKYKTFVSSAHDVESTLEEVLTSWTRFENNLNLITAWLDEQQRIAPSNVPMEILSKWKSVHKSLNHDGNFLIERTYEKTASKIAHKLKTLNHRWTTYVKQYKEQKEVNNGSVAEEDLGVDSTEGASRPQLDPSALSLSLYIQSLQSGEDARTVDMYSEVLSQLEAMEKVVETADNWSGKAEQLLSELEKKENTQEPSSVDIQNFYDNGVSCQEQLEKAEVNMQALTQLVHSQEDCQCIDVDEWGNNVVRARERVQDLVSSVSLVLHPPEQSLSEEDIKRNFESSKGNLETYITKAVSLLGEKVTPEEFISQYETSLSKFGHQDLEHFLKATEHMKNISSSTKEKSLVEQVSADVRNRWKIVRDELEAYVSELKIHLGKKKFDELVWKMDNQISREKNRIGAMDIEELIMEHEVVFSDCGCLGELNQCLQTMQTLDDQLRTGAGPTTFTAIITECTKKKKKMQKNAADIYRHLQSTLRKHQIDKRDVASADRGMKLQLNKSNGTQRARKTADVLQETNMAEDIELNGSTLEILLQRYDAEKSDLEIVIQKSRDRLVAESPSEVQDVKELQSKLHELQILLDQANRSWMEFEATSKKVERLLHGAEKKDISEKRNALQSSLGSVLEEITSRIQSLSITINVLLPIEEEVSLLCESNGQTPIQEVEQFTISSIGSVYQDLKEVQHLVKDQIQQCHHLESAPEVVDPSSPVDGQAVQSVVQQYKIQLRTTKEIMKEREVLLKELEVFLSSVAATKLAIQAEAGMISNDRSSLLQKQSNLEKLQQKVHRLRRDAEQLDRRLEPAEIFLEDPESGEPTSCQKMIDGFPEKIEIVLQSTLLELRNLESRSASGIQALNGTLNNSSSTDHMVPLLTQEPGMEQFTVSKIDTILQEIKDVKNTFETEIQQLDSLDALSTEPISQYKTELQATNEAIMQRETTLKSLGVFLSTLKATKMSIEAGFPMPGMDRTTLQEKQLSLESLEKDIYLLGQEAEKLDDSMQAAGIVLEDPENRGETSCKKMISGFFEMLESAQQAVQREIQNLQETVTLEQLNQRVKDFCKDIEEIQNQIDQVGLKDPTIHAVQQRMKSLITLEKTLETFDKEIKSIADAFKEVLHTSQRKDLTGYEECVELWEDTTQYLAHSKEQCEVIIELLRKFHHYRTTLTTLVQKAETTISHQSSYIGKDKLHKLMMKVQELKQEIEDQSGNAEEISTICKKLQSQISKIKKFEDAPFQVEANMLIDKWLDVCEKLDSHHENIKSAVSLWNRVLHLSQEVEPWTEGKIKLLESVSHTSDELRLLQTELQHQEELIEELSKKSAEIQKLLQTDELPFELQVIKTSLVNKIAVISTIVSEKSENEDKSLVAAASDSPDSCSDAKQFPQITGNEPVNGDLHVQMKVETCGMEVEPEALPNDRPQSPTTTLVVDPKRADIQEKSQEEPQGDEKSEALRQRLAELQKRRAKLSPDLQPRVLDSERQLAAFRELLHESQEMMGILEDSEQLSHVSPGQGLYGQWLEIKLVLETFVLELQETMQILERRLEGHRHYESLSDALNDKMTSFYEELLNFSRSSRENVPCELKRQKLQALRDQYEGLQSDLDQVSQLAENIKLTSSSEAITRVQVAMDMHRSKIRGCLERIDYQALVIEQPPIVEKPKGKKTKKGSKKKSERHRSTEEMSQETTIKVKEDYLAKATVSSVVQTPEQTTVQPVVDVLLQDRTDHLVQTVELIAPGEASAQSAQEPIGRSTMESALEPSVQTRREDSLALTMKTPAQPTMEPSKHPEEIGLSTQPALVPSKQTALKLSDQTTRKSSGHLTVEPTLQDTGKLSGKSTVKQCVPLTREPPAQPIAELFMQHPAEPSGQPTEDLFVQFTGEQSVQLMVETSKQLKVEPPEKLTEEASVQPTKGPSRQSTIVQFTVEKPIKPAVEPPEQLTVKLPEQPTVEPSEQLKIGPSQQPTVEPPEKLTVEPAEQPRLEPLEQPTEQLLVQPSVDPSVQPTVEPIVQSAVEPLVQPRVEPLVQPTEELLEHPDIEQSVQPTGELLEQLIVEPSVQPTVETPVQPTVETPVQPTVETYVQHTVETYVQPTVETSVQHTVETPVQPTVETYVQPTVETYVQPTVETPVQPTAETSVQPTVETSVQHTVETYVQHTVETPVQPTVETPVQPTAETSVQPTVETSVQHTVETYVQHTVETYVQPTVETSVQHTVETYVQPTVETPVQPTVETPVQPTAETSVQPTVETSVQPTVETPVQPTAETSVQPTVETYVQHTVETYVQPTVETSVQHTVETYVQPTVETPVQPTVETPVQPTAETSVQPTVETSVQPTVETPVQPTAETSVQPTVETSVQHTVETYVQPTVETPVQPTVETSVHYSVEPSVQPIVETSVQHSVETSVQHSVEASVLGSSLLLPGVESLLQSQEETLLQPLTPPTEEAVLPNTIDIDVLPTVDPTLKSPVVDSIEDAAKNRVNGSVRLAIDLAQDSRVEPALEAVGLPTAESYQTPVQPKDKLTLQTTEKPKDQSTLKPTGTENGKEKKSAKSKKKKKLAGKQSVESKAGKEPITSMKKRDTKSQSAESVDGESIHKEHSVDLTDSSEKTAGKKALEEVNAGQREASGQPQTLLQDCNSYTRELETSVKVLTISDNYASGLITTVEERPRGAETFPDGKEKLEVQDGELVSDGQTSALHVPGSLQPDDFQAQCEILSKELQPHIAAYHQEALEIFSKISLILGEELLKENPLERLACKFKPGYSTEDTAMGPGKNPEDFHIEDLKRSMRKFSKEPIKFSVMELDQEIEEIEKLCKDVSKLQESWKKLKAQDEDAQSSAILPSDHEDLLNQLMALKAEKQKLRQDYMDFQNALSAARLSYQMLVKEKESLKMSSTESHQNHLNKLEHFLNKLAQEKENLSMWKAQQSNIEGYRILGINQDETDVDIRQLEVFWEQIELSIHREQDRLIKEAEELRFLQQKVDQLQSVIQVQQELLDQPTPSREDIVKTSLLLSADVESLQHLSTSLRNMCELQIKRCWGANESQSLECSLDNLQSSLESFEERVKDQQVTRCQTPDALINQYLFLKPLYDSHIWIKKLQNKMALDQTIALLPGDVEQQIATSKKVHKEILDRQTAVNSFIEESKHISQGIDPAAFRDICSFFQQLQELYQEQIMQSVDRLQKLESGLEKRKALFSEIEKLKELLHCLEKEATPVKRGIFTAAELCEQLNCLKAKTTELEEIEGLVLTLLRNSQSYHRELKISEQLYLNDILRSLKSKARRIRRLEEKKFLHAEKLLRIYNEFQERTTSLSRELSSLQPIEPTMHDEAENQVGQGFQKKFQVSQNAISSSQVHLSEILRYKDLFEDSGLYWDGLTVDNLQNKCFPVHRSGHFDHYEPLKERYQELLEEARVMCCSVQRQALALGTHFDVIEAQVLCKKVKKISRLATEALSLLLEKHDSQGAVPDEEPTIRDLAENMDRLHQSLSQMITGFHTMEKSIHYRLEETLCNLREIHQGLLQPCVVHLDVNEIQEQLLRLEALDEICKSELNSARAISAQASTEGLLGRLNDIEQTGKQVENAVTQNIDTVKKTFHDLQDLQQTIAKLAELFRQYDEKLQVNAFDCSDEEDNADFLNSQQEGMNIAIAEIHNIVKQLKSGCNPHDKEQLDGLVNQITSKNIVLTEMAERKQSALASYREKQLLFRCNKEKICKDLEEMEAIMRDSFFQKPPSYKAALAQWERSKNIVTKVISCEGELLQLRQAARDLSAVSGDDVMLFDKSVASLWDRWLNLLGVCRDWELYCDELKQEWKLISELMEREVILLDNCQEEIPDKPELKQRSAQLLNSVSEISRFEETVKTQKLQLSLLLHRLQNILGKPEVNTEMEISTVIKEINSMEDKCKILLQNCQKRKEEIHTELEDREALKGKIYAVRQSLQKVSSKLENSDQGDPESTRASLQEIQNEIESQKETAKLVMEKVSARYAELAPAELLSQVEECQEYLQEMDQKVQSKVLQNSPENVMNRKVEEIKSGLQSIEVHLTEKSQDIQQAKELQNKLWDEVDSWLSKLHALEAEVQEMAEEDPSQAQEWMDKLMEPLGHYQQVTHLVERRTANLNKAASKLEEYEDTLKSIQTWIQNTDTLLNEEMKDCSAKVLNKHVVALEIALDDSEQKQHLLDSIHSELSELATIFETESIVERISDIRKQVLDLKLRILKVLPAIQLITHEVLAIEDEVKKMERTINKIKTILTSNDIDDMTPNDHYMHGQVMLDNINHIKKTIAEIEAYRPTLPLSESGVQSLCVFRRMVVVLREAEMLEKVIMDQNQLLEPIISEMSELEKEHEKAQQVSREDLSDMKEKNEDMKKQMERLNQKKEVILLAQRDSLNEQLERIRLEPHDQDLGAMLSPITEGKDPIQMERRDSHTLPSLVEETEDSTLVVEAAEDSTGVKPDHEEEVTDVPSLSQEQLGDAGKALADVQPKMILSDCQGKVTEVELWLQKVTLSPHESRQDPDMLQSVEEQLTEYQKTLQETEMKINLLLEDADYRQQGNVTVLEEAEILSQKLKALKASLEHVQEMLQAKSMGEQIHNGVKEEKSLHPLPSRTADPAEKTHVLSTAMSKKKHPAEITLPQEAYIPSYPRSPAGDGPSTPTKSRSKTPLSVIEDITWSKWLYLQRELSYRMKATSSRHTNEPDALKEVKISFISRIPVSTVKSPLIEESKQFLRRLKTLNEEASSPLTQESARNLHGALFVWMCSVSQWLQNIEEMLDLDNLTREEAAAELTFYEKLTKDLHALSEEMGSNTSSLLSPITHEGAHTSILSQCYSDLRGWLLQIHNTAKTRSRCMQGELDKHNNYQNDICLLYDVLVKKKTDLIQRLSNSGIGEPAGLIQVAAVYEDELLSLENQVSTLNERGEKLSIPICSNQEIHKLEDVLDDTWHILRSHQDTCSSAIISKAQVETLLRGLYELLSLGKEKIEKSREYCSRSKESLNSHIENHRKFFSHLESQVLLLQDFSSRNPDLVKPIETVTQEAETLRQHSDDHCINIMVLMKNWNDFDSKYDYIMKKYEALEATIPTSSLVEESVERVTERLKQYQKVQKHIDENESRLSQLVVAGKTLQSTVACSELDGQITKMEQQWTQLSKKVNHELHRLESLISHLTSYNKDSSELSTWLESARQKLSISRMQSLDASQKLDTIRNNLNNFFEFTNDVDQKSSLKTSVVNAGNQLLRLRESDTSVLKLNLTKFEEGWTELIGALPATQDKLQQQLVEKLPSLEAIRDLMDWMKEDNEIRELHSVQNIPTTTADIRVILQRYKGLKREMSHKQWIVDYVNQSLLQLSVGDVESKRYERTELAELLGTLNLQWNQMQGNISAKIQLLEQALESISDQESRRQTVSNWFDAQHQRLKKLHRPSSITAAESVLAECMVLEEQLKAKSDGIEGLDANSMATGGQNVSNEDALTTETLVNKRDQVTKQVAILKTSTLSMLNHWKDYNENYGHIERMTVKLQYALDQCTSPSSSMNSLNLQLKKSQAVQEEVEQHEEKWSRLRASLGSLKSLCSQSAIDNLEQECREVHQRWTSAGNKLSEYLRAARSLIQVWKDYTGSCLELAPHIEQVEAKCEQLLCAKLSEDRESDSLEQRIQDLKALEHNLQGLRAHNLQVSELSDKVLRQNPAASNVIQSERQNTSHRIAYLERRVSSKAAELTFIQNEVESFKGDLDKLQSRIKSSADVVSHVYHTQKEKEERSEVIKTHLLELSELTYDVERLNEEMFTLPLHDRTQMLLHSLNHMWAKTMATALEDCRQHRMIELEKNNFIQNYETWMLCLEKMEENLTEGIAGTFEALTKQQEIYERLQAEITINEHILPSFVNKALSVLELEDEQNRNELILKLTSLKEKWQSVIRLVQQRKKEISALLKQWWQFRVSKQSLEQQLRDIQESVSSVSHHRCLSLINTEKLMYDFKDKERRLMRLQPSYFTTLSNCKNILSFSEPKSKEVLERDRNQLQELWQSTAQQLQDILTYFSGIAQKRHHFEVKIEDKRKMFHDLKAKVNEPLPTLHEELQIAKRPLKELEEALDEWGDSLKDLDDMKSELSQYIIAEDGIVLGNQVEALHRQWEELCLRVSMRKQEIEDRLNAWNVFNEKNKELCDWLTQMESKVLQTGDVNIEEMIEKLQKDCMEEINLFSENKLHLKQIGDQLIHASNQARSKEIENKLNKVNDRWKHLFDVIGSRVKKLKETLVTIQQLYKNMSNLRTWLARIESELSKPVIYSICDDQEINKKLEEQRDLQKDIEVHSPGVASVLNICERLLHDTDACANETECDSIQQTTRSLDKRWRNICTMSVERRMRIEETCRLWQKFLEDYSRFDEWLKEAEAMAASPDSSDVLFTKAKEEQKKFEAFQRQIHERLTHLELINKQYRRLARENRTDAASKLKQMVHEGNLRWDQLQRRVTAILRRLKHFTSQREDFESSRDCILVWLTEMDLQLTNVEHFSESDIEEKMQQLIGFKQEITLNTNKIDQLIVFGEQLIQKSEAMDAVVIEDELEEIHRYCQEVFGRVYRFHERLTSRNLNLEEERETSENDTDGEDSREIQNSSWHSTIPDVETSHQSLCHLMPPTLPHERSGRETPVSVDSIPLEWDPTVDVGGSSMHENEEEGAYYTPLSDVEIAESPEAYVIMTTKTVQASSGKSDLETPSWHSPDKHGKMEFKEDKKVKRRVGAISGNISLLDQSSSAQETSGPTGAINSRTLSSDSEKLEDKGLQGMKRPETHSGVIERWEIINAQTMSNEHTKKQRLQRWQRLNDDLDNLTLWLDKTEVELDQAKRLKQSTTIQELEQKVKMLKDMLKAFDDYKARVISVNLNSKEFQSEDDETRSRDVLNRLHMVNVRWERASRDQDGWRESLQNDLLQCEEFQERSHQLLLWLTEAEERRLKYRVTDSGEDPHALLESQRNLMRLEEQLLERQSEVDSLQDVSSNLLSSTAGAGYIEAEERMHVIGTKLRQLLLDVSQDLAAVQKALDTASDEVDSLVSPTTHKQTTVRAASKDSTRSGRPQDDVQEAPKKRSLFYRVLRAAFPLQLLLLLLLFFACMIPVSEDDFSCAQANNFARSFYPMLRYTNGPPPT
ncbi:nesprin-2 isoform X2 [Dendropsophus ebraccatus]|uniref:nesprin-2 isoform X2 n=1 Tax=Dendropsophus ebraccatus TaxID=150705 RepID=UPI0038313ED4